MSVQWSRVPQFSSSHPVVSDGGAFSAPIADLHVRSKNQAKQVRVARSFSVDVAQHLEFGKSLTMGSRGAFGRTEASEVLRGTVSVKCDQPDRFEGAGFRAGAIPLGSAAERFAGSVRIAGHRYGFNRCGRHGFAGALRATTFPRRSVSARLRRHVVLLPWGRGFSKARQCGQNNSDRFYTRAHRHYRSSGFCGAGSVFPDVGTREIFAVPRRSAEKTIGQTARGTRYVSEHDQEQAPHIPVMLDEVLGSLLPAGGAHIVDGTFGAGGYSKAILAKGARVTGFDRDPDAIESAQPIIDAHNGKLALVEAPFSTMAEHLEPASVDGVVLDIGVSSMQFDQAERGFSFRFDGPLDMRMAQTGLSAADVVNNFAVNDLIRIIGILGEEKRASKIAKSIVDARQMGVIDTTLQLAKIVENAAPRKPGDKIHPATRTFQGLRIFINDELNELARALYAAEEILKPGGKLVVVTFHSLEDRIVKRYFQDRTSQGGGSRHLPAAAINEALYSVEGKAVIAATKAEAEQNPRARSAKLRAATRTVAPLRKADFSIFKLPNLPWPKQGDAADRRNGRGH